MQKVENILIEIFNSIIETAKVYITRREVKAQPLFVPVNKKFRR